MDLEDGGEEKQIKLLKTLQEFQTYIENNASFIPNYGGRYRYGETISSAFVKSTVNQVISDSLGEKTTDALESAGCSSGDSSAN